MSGTTSSFLATIDAKSPGIIRSTAALYILFVSCALHATFASRMSPWDILELTLSNYGMVLAEVRFCQAVLAKRHLGRRMPRF